jgi:hypothetical protein
MLKISSISCIVVTVMSLKKLIPLIIIFGIILAIPAQVQARPNQNRPTSITINDVIVDDYDADGVKEDALIQGTLTLSSNNSQTNIRCVITYYLTYVPDGAYDGPMTYGTSWVFYKTYNGFTSTPDGSDNAFEYNIDNLPYPGWYSIRAASMVKGQVAISEAFIFDPPGGGPGPIGR